MSAVTFEGYYFDRSDQIILASSRVAGICTGVLAALLLTCTVFPISGSGMVRQRNPMSSSYAHPDHISLPHRPSRPLLRTHHQRHLVSCVPHHRWTEACRLSVRWPPC